MHLSIANFLTCGGYDPLCAFVFVLNYVLYVVVHAETIAVLGAGQMGAGIAEVSAKNGMGVMLKDRDEEGIARGKLYVFCINKHDGDGLEKPRVHIRSMVVVTLALLTRSPFNDIYVAPNPYMDIIYGCYCYCYLDNVE